jgi:hypothetical protein
MPIEQLKPTSMYKRLICVAALTLTYSFNPGRAQTSHNIGQVDQIISTARSHLTPKGVAWSKSEAGRIRRGKVDAAQVEKDVARVRDGLRRDAVPDELVLVALLEARIGAGKNQYDSVKLDSSIQNIIETLKDTQRPSEISRSSGR